MATGWSASSPAGRTWSGSAGGPARLTGSEVFESVCEGIGGSEGDLEISRLSIADETLQFDLVTHRATREVRRGDILLAGVHVTHSLTCDFATKVEGHLLRLLCTNGTRTGSSSRLARATARGTSPRAIPGPRPSSGTSFATWRLTPSAI